MHSLHQSIYLTFLKFWWFTHILSWFTYRKFYTSSSITNCCTIRIRLRLILSILYIVIYCVTGNGIITPFNDYEVSWVEYLWFKVEWCELWSFPEELFRLLNFSLQRNLIGGLIFSSLEYSRIYEIGSHLWHSRRTLLNHLRDIPTLPHLAICDCTFNSYNYFIYLTNFVHHLICINTHLNFLWV